MFKLFNTVARNAQPYSESELLAYAKPVEHTTQIKDLLSDEMYVLLCEFLDECDLLAAA